MPKSVRVLVWLRLKSGEYRKLVVYLMHNIHKYLQSSVDDKKVEFIHNQ